MDALYSDPQNSILPQDPSQDMYPDMSTERTYREFNSSNDPLAIYQQHDDQSNNDSYDPSSIILSYRPQNTGAKSPLPLQVAMSFPAEHDPLESTARPGHSQAHAQFHNAIGTKQHGPSDLSTSTLPSHHQQEHPYTFSTPGITQGLSRPLTDEEQTRLQHLDRLKFFLATAPSHWDNDANTNSMDQVGQNGMSHPLLHRFALPPSQQHNNPALGPAMGEHVTCVLWNGLYHITGTDIVRALIFRFEAFGRPVRNIKKFEEGVFSDLRNLKPGIDATLEEPKSPFLDLLFKYQCIRTQKKQKVFYWFSVPHDRLFLDALERDLKREKAGGELTTVVVGEPAISFTYDPKRSLYEQFSKVGGPKEGEGELEAAVRRFDESSAQNQPLLIARRMSGMSDSSDDAASSDDDRLPRRASLAPEGAAAAPFFSFSLSAGSPMYKQRRRRGLKPNGGVPMRKMSNEDQERGRRFTTDELRNRFANASHSQSRERYPYEMDASDGYMSAPQDFQAAMPTRHPHGGNFRRKSLDVQQRHPFPMPGSVAQSMSAPYTMQSFPSQLNHSPYGHGAWGPPESTSRAFQCPVESCNRLFKRLEHLKRHSLTHTLERPHRCNLCSKAFSRSDNLQQHMRTHQAGNFGGSDWEDGSAGSGASAGSLSEDEGLSMTNNYEVEVTGQIWDVPGDEEGLITVVDQPFNPPLVPSQDAYFNSTNATFGGSPGMVQQYPDASQQWEHRSRPSFSSEASASPEPVVSNLRNGHHSGNSSLNGSPSGFLRRLSPGVYNAHSEITSSDYMASMSAPSHTLAFGPSPTPYGSNTLGLAASNVNGSDGLGVQRRHRSVTPSLIRGGEVPRRASTMGEYGMPSTAPVASGRHFHPYAAAMNRSRNSSASSTPAHYSVPLEEPDLAQAPQMHVRSMSHGHGMQEQMRSLGAMKFDPPNFVNPAFSGDIYNDTFPGSPMPFTHPLPYVSNPLPGPYHHSPPATGAMYGDGAFPSQQVSELSDQFFANIHQSQQNSI